MAAGTPRINQNLFPASELASDAEVEALETQPQQQPPAEGPTGLSAEEQSPPEKPQPQQPPHEEVIPYEKWRLEHEANQRLEQELAAHREFRTRLDERQRLIQEANEQAQRAAAEQRRMQERPDPSLDPVGAELWDLKTGRAQDRATIEQLQQNLNQFGQNYQSVQEQQTFTNWVTNEANQYAATDPNYIPAAKYAAQKRVDFWQSIMPNAPQGLAERIVQGESIMIARLAQQYGGRFAPAVAELARSWGFSPQPANGNGNNMARPPVNPQAAQRQANLQQVRQGQRLQGLSAVPNGNAPEGVTAFRNMGPAEIAALSDEQFNAAMANPVSRRDLQYAMARAEGFDSGEVNW